MRHSKRELMLPPDGQRLTFPHHRILADHTHKKKIVNREHMADSLETSATALQYGIHPA